MPVEEGPIAEGPLREARDMGALRVSIEDAGAGTSVVSLVGELDLASTHDVAACLAGVLAQGRDVLVDLSGLRFIDSTGMSALVVAHRRGERDGRHVTLRRPAPNVLRTLHIAGLDAVLAIER